MHPILKKLAGGDRRSIGCANQVAEEIVADSALFSIVLEGLLHDDPIIRMRAADAVEKASSTRPELLQPYKRRLLGDVMPRPVVRL